MRALGIIWDLTRHIISSFIPADAYAAIAFEDSYHNIIIANEGANIASSPGRATPYQNNSFLAYVDILRGTTPRALSDAVTFVSKVQQDIQQNSDVNGKIYVTGHDLGGVEAEAQMQAFPSLAGGVTFGASGLPGNDANGPDTLVNYVDYGDTVGYWDSDGAGPLKSLVPAHMYHYGRVREVGNLYSSALVLFGSNINKELSAIDDALNPLSFLEETFGDKLPMIKTANRLVAWTGLQRVEFNKRVTAALTVSQYSSLGATTLLYHRIGHYAVDFNISLKQKVTPPITMQQFLKLYDPTPTQEELKEAGSTTVNANKGKLKEPNIAISFDTQTGTITDETYTAADDTTYDAIFDARELVSSILVNESTGGSYRLYNDDFNTHIWSSYATFYEGKNGKGALIEILYNWDAGGSQVQLYTNLPHGVSAEIRNYSGPDGTGKLLSVQRL